MATRENTDYLRFNAFAIRDLITRKLAQDSNFTDQIYAGSNLAVLIDIVSYMYQTLMYNLNSAAAETMWSDTKIYENINRLSQFLGYNPHGMNPSYAVFSFPDNGKLSSDAYIPRYSYIDTGKTDAAGNPIFFSTVSDVLLKENNTESPEVIMYNGKWKLYSTVFTAEGTDWETFVLNGIRSDAATGDYVANNFIHVYVAEPENGLYKKPEQYFATDTGLFKSKNEYFANVSDKDSEIFKPYPSLYSPEDKVFNLRLDETKTYTITFGNNRQGKKLKKGSAIFVFYLDSNGPIESFDINEIQGTIFSNVHSFQATKNGINFETIFRNESTKALDIIPNAHNISPRMGFALEESVDEIRDFAPNWFRMGNRLVTQRDYEYYMKNSPQFRGVFADIKCMNNWGYMSTFYKWLYDLGLKYRNTIDDSDKLGGRRFLTSDRLLKSGRRYADPADSNNIYLWYLNSESPKVDETGTIELETSNSILMPGARNESIKEHLLRIKDLTHEPTLVPPVFVVFRLCGYLNDEPLGNGTSPQEISDKLVKVNEYLSNSVRNSYIEITVDDEVIYASATLQTAVTNIIEKFFKYNYRLGGYVDFNELQNKIFEINGINKIRTVYKDPNNTNFYVAKNGVSFASYSYDAILLSLSKDPLLDLEISSAGRSLESFQVPLLDFSSLQVKVIKKSAAALNTVIY